MAKPKKTASKGEVKMNNEHGKIYDKIDDTRKELSKKIDSNLERIEEVNKNISGIKTSVASIDTKLTNLPCKPHNDVIEDLQSKVDQASGAIKTINFLLVVIGIIGGIISLAVVFGII